MKHKIFFSSLIIIYFLVLFQTSFLSHFLVWGYTPNLVLIVVFLWNILESEKDHTGLFVALASGFFLDIFSSRFIGFNVLILLFFALLIKFFIKKHARISISQKT